MIGINSQIQTGGGSNGNVGIGFAVPINTAREVVKQIEEHGKVKHAYLGISGGSDHPRARQGANLPVEEGVLVAEVVKGGPADKAGIEGGDTRRRSKAPSVRLGGDIITEVDGKKVTGMEDVINVVDGAQPGDKIELTARCAAATTKTVTVTLGVRPARSKKAPQVRPPVRASQPGDSRR